MENEIKIPITWTSLVEPFLAVMENGTPEGKRVVREELYKMAKAADLAAKHGRIVVEADDTEEK